MSGDTTVYRGGDQLPRCQIAAVHGGERPEAAVDGKTVDGPWAYMCDGCHRRFGVGLGTGRGQRLVLPRGEES